MKTLPVTYRHRRRKHHFILFKQAPADTDVHGPRDVLNQNLQPRQHQQPLLFLLFPLFPLFPLFLQWGGVRRLRNAVVVPENQ
jgi:hypothetical protein